ncbi:MAG TPA: hypothetical protein VGD98_12470 [Ktedonobacteraceae bacterium]
MNEIQEAGTGESSSQELPGPQGIGMAVAFSWGLAVQVLLVPGIALFSQSTLLKISGISQTLSNVLGLILALLVACGLVLFGEMVRSGRNWARLVQIVANALLTLGGIFSLVNVYQGARTGNFWPLITTVILLVFSPLIARRLSRSRTAHWFKVITPAEARKRHGGAWVWFIALWALAGGILQTLAAMK